MMVRITKATEERRLEIIETARKLFSERGFSNTPVDAIIKEMGVAKGTFYHYFKSKEEVLDAIVDQTLDQMVKVAEQVAEETSMNALAKMELLLSNSQFGDEEVHGKDNSCGATFTPIAQSGTARPHKYSNQRATSSPG